MSLLSRTKQKIRPVYRAIRQKRQNDTYLKAYQKYAFDETGELSDEQYTDALTECDHILRDLCFDIAKTNTWCSEIRELVEARIAAGEEITKCRDV